MQLVQMNKIKLTAHLSLSTLNNNGHSKKRPCSSSQLTFIIAIPRSVCHFNPLKTARWFHSVISNNSKGDRNDRIIRFLR